MTVRARSDPDYPGSLFVALRRYELPGASAPDASAEVANAAEALEVLRRWFADLDDDSPPGPAGPPGAP